MEELERAIKRTIDYGRSYGEPWTKEEVAGVLISGQYFNKKEIAEELDKVEGLEEKNTNSSYCEKLRIAERVAGNISKIFKNIILVGITGSVASGHPKVNDDIDFLIITKNDRLWLTRLINFVWLKISGEKIRRKGRQEKNNDLCFNVWLEESSLRIPAERRCLRTAVDLLLCKPLINKDGTYRKFLKANGWVKKYSTSGWTELTKGTKKEKGSKDRKVSGGKFGRQLNELAYRWQYSRINRCKLKEIVEYRRAFFHPWG